MGAVAIVFYLESRGYWWVMPPRALLAAVAPMFLSFGLRALYTGDVSIKNFTFRRSKNPIMYWVEVAVLLSLGIVLLLGGIGVIWP